MSAAITSGSGSPTWCTRGRLRTGCRPLTVTSRGFQFLPLAARAFLARRWPLRPATPKSPEAALRDALDVELPSRSEMRLYFPGSRIIAERAFGLPKSLIAVRGGSAVLSSGGNIRTST